MAFDNSCFLVIGAYGGIGSVVCKILKKTQNAQRLLNFIKSGHTDRALTNYIG